MFLKRFPSACRVELHRRPWAQRDGACFSTGPRVPRVADVRRAVWARALLLVVVAAALCWGGPPAASAAGGLSFVPRVGGPHATFVARFVAPFPVVPRGDAAYFLNVVGPCDVDFGVSNFTHISLETGDTATVFMSADDHEGHWCPGFYVGSITYEAVGPSGPKVARTLFSGFTFRVLSRDRLRRLAARPNRVRIFPRVGSLRETFVLRFTAPYRTGGRLESQYEFSGRGPRHCRSVWDAHLSENLVRGDRAVIALDPASIGNIGRRQWCPGRYRGHVNYVRFNQDYDVVLRRRVASNIRFTVRGG